jgi:uncharacterized protein YkwD/murein DD-endopeptidase MepM/ murein hydrolase activator NlpD
MDLTAQLRSALVRLIVAGQLLSLLFMLPRAVCAQEGGLTATGQAVADAVNQARAEHGLGPLAVHPLLNQAAQNHVNDMVNNWIYGHYGSDGSSVHTRVARTGYAQTPWVSENWVSSTSVAGAMNWWMNDWIHRVNILNGNWQEIGVGVGTRGGEMIFVTVFSGGGGEAVATAAGDVAAAPVPVALAEASAPPAAAQPLSVPPEGMDYTIQAGDTLLAIALRHGMQWETIAGANGLGEASVLQIGNVIRLPGANESSMGIGGPAAESAPTAPTVDYTVAEGDTLFSIAARRGLTWQQVASANGFGERTVLQIGQVIQVPDVKIEEDNAFEQFLAANVDRSNWHDGEAGVSEVLRSAAGSADTDPVAAAGVEMNAEASATTASATTASVTTASVTTEASLYIVAEGDTIFGIAVANGLDWNDLLALNGLAEDAFLQPGQTLRLR